MGFDQAAVGWDLVPFLQQQPIPWHHLIRCSDYQGVIAPHPHLSGEGAAQGVKGAFGLVLLPEGKEAVDQHHGPDRQRQLGGAGSQGQGSRNPQQQGHHVKQLVAEAQQQRPSFEAGQTVGSKTCQAFTGDVLTEPRGCALQGMDHLSSRQRPDRMGGREVHGDGGPAAEAILLQFGEV